MTGARKRTTNAVFSAPISRLAEDSVSVIAARLSSLPWQWATSPLDASRETQLMFAEKHDAAAETWMALLESPWHFWADVMMAGAGKTPELALEHATRRASKRIIGPASRRVQANRRRLGA